MIHATTDAANQNRFKNFDNEDWAAYLAAECNFSEEEEDSILHDFNNLRAAEVVELVDGLISDNVMKALKAHFNVKKVEGASSEDNELLDEETRRILRNADTSDWAAMQTEHQEEEIRRAGSYANYIAHKSK